MILLDPGAHPIIGHRGAAGAYPENTMLSFDRALAEGADALELDVRLTGDGVPVVIHDAVLDRTTNGEGLVRELPAATIRALNAGRGQSVPLLVDVLETYPDTPLIIEIKESAAGGPVAALLRKCGAARRVLVGAFQRAALRPFRPPEFARAASRSEAAGFWGASRMGLAVAAASIAAFTVPERYRGVRVVDRRFVRAARRRGKPVHVWTVNEPAVARRLRLIGVAGIITDVPDRIRGALMSHVEHVD